MADTRMELGMRHGPALALPVVGPDLSLPNRPAIARAFGARKAAIYLGTVVLLETGVGWS